MEFKVTITREGDGYTAQCAEVSDAVASGTSIKDVLDRIAAIIRKKLSDDSGGGAAAAPHPTWPPPRDPLAAEQEE